MRTTVLFAWVPAEDHKMHTRLHEDTFPSYTTREMLIKYRDSNENIDRQICQKSRLMAVGVGRFGSANGLCRSPLIDATTPAYSGSIWPGLRGIGGNNMIADLLPLVPSMGEKF